jgi:hypothetical protein
MKRKGVFRGAMDTGLDAVPFLGAAKNVVEIARGRDFFPDRPALAPSPAMRVQSLRAGAD